MSVVQEAKGILADAEKALRDLMQRELKAHSYSELAELARIADGLNRLSGGGANLTPNASSMRTTISHKRVVSATSKRKPPQGRKRSYPRFERDGDKLVKIGWSKKSREEYEHRAPRQAVLAFLSHLANSIASGKSFAIEDILPVHDPAGEELPSYQVYLAIAWLRDRNAVEKKGRDGYVLIHKALDGSTFDQLWSETPERR